MELRTNVIVNARSSEYHRLQSRNSTLRSLATLLVSTLLLSVPVTAQSQNHSDNQGDNGQSQNGLSGGDVVPPNVKPNGYSLDDMAKLMALFTTSGNNLTYYPKTPFQILYADTNLTTPKDCPRPPGGTGIRVTGGNTFAVRPGTPFFVPLQEYDDSPIVVGQYPSRKSQVADYVFGPAGYGGRDYQIIVDGDKTSLGPEFLAGPVQTPPLLNGGGTHSIQLGVFLTAMSVGTHSVTIKGEVASDAFFRATPPNNISCLAQDFIYTVRVVPDH